MTVVGTARMRAIQSPRLSRDITLAGSTGGLVRVRRTDELVRAEAGSAVE